MIFYYFKTKKPREFDSTQGVIRPKDSFARERLSKNNMVNDDIEFIVLSTCKMMYDKLKS